MVRAIALLALLEAVRHGEYRATFHGFRVEAVRHHGIGHDGPTVEVSMVVTLAETVVERCALDVGLMSWPSCESDWHLPRVENGETSLDCHGH